MRHERCERAVRVECKTGPRFRKHTSFVQSERRMAHVLITGRMTQNKHVLSGLAMGDETRVRPICPNVDDYADDTSDGHAVRWSKAMNYRPSVQDRLSYIREQSHHELTN